MKNPHDIILRPVLTEKGYDGIADKRYVFEVAISANKTEIKQALETVFEGIKVEKVNTVRTVLVYCAVTVAMRLMGKRQLGELQPAELVTTLLISNVASICIDEPDLPLLASLVPIFLITALEILNSTLLWFSPAYAELLLGRPVTVIRNGKIQQDALAQLRITVSDLAEALRGRDIFSPQEVYWGVVEPNGSISAASMPKDGQEPPLLPLLIDTAACRENLAFFGMDEAALDALLAERHTTRKNVLLLLHNGKRSVLIQKKTAPEGTV